MTSSYNFKLKNEDNAIMMDWEKILGLRTKVLDLNHVDALY